MPSVLRRFQTSVLLPLLVLSGTGCDTEPRSRPNVIVLVVDTLRADHLGSYGYPGDVSPALDRLAGESLVFENAFVQSPWTKPSTASLITSLYPQVHRVTTHQGKNWGGLQGVDHGGSMVLAPQAVTLAEVLRDDGYRTAAFVANPFISAEFGFDQGFETYDVRLNFEANRADRLVEAARTWLDSLPSGQPFLLYLHFMDVHAPYAAPQEDYQALENSVPPGNHVLSRSESPERFQNIEVRPPWATDAMRRRVDYWQIRYASGVRMLDRKVEPLLTHLRDSGLLDTSYLLLTSDHGEELFEHGSWSHGYSYYDHQLHVPLIIRSPGGLGRGRTSELVEAIDVMPTLLSALGVPIPSQAQGRDVSALFSEGRIDAATASFAGAGLTPRPTYALRTLDHKLILDLENGSARLYDLRVDPGEQQDVASAEAVLTARLTATLRAHLAESVAGGVLDAEAVEIPDDVLKSIEALGYVGR